MISILEQLYDGDIFPIEQFSPKAEEYKTLWKTLFFHYEDFIIKLEALDPELCEEFAQIIDEQIDTVPLEFSQMFIDGFRLGAKTVIEIYENDITDSTTMD